VLIELYSLGVTAKALRTKIDRKWTISLQRGPFDPKFQVGEVAPTPTIFARIVRPSATQPQHYNFVADSFHTKKFYSRLISSEVRLYTEIGRFAFLSPQWA